RIRMDQFVAPRCCDAAAVQSGGLKRPVLALAPGLHFGCHVALLPLATREIVSVHNRITYDMAHMAADRGRSRLASPFGLVRDCGDDGGRKGWPRRKPW